MTDINNNYSDGLLKRLHLKGLTDGRKEQTETKPEEQQEEKPQVKPEYKEDNAGSMQALDYQAIMNSSLVKNTKIENANGKFGEPIDLNTTKSIKINGEDVSISGSGKFYIAVEGNNVVIQATSTSSSIKFNNTADLDLNITVEKSAKAPNKVFALTTGSGNDTIIINEGAKISTLTTNAGDDNVIVAKNATVSSINTKAGDDTVVNFGTVTGSVNTDDGADVVLNKGTVRTSINTGKNNDIIQNDGTAGNLYGANDNDQIINNGKFTNKLDGNAGTDVIINGKTVIFENTKKNITLKENETAVINADGSVSITNTKVLEGTKYCNTKLVTTYTKTGDPAETKYMVSTEDGKTTKVYDNVSSTKLLAVIFTQENKESVVLEAPADGSLVENETGTFTLTHADGTIESFDTDGTLIFGSKNEVPYHINVNNFFEMIDKNNDRNITAEEINKAYNETKDGNLKELLKYLTDGENVTQAFILACEGKIRGSYEKGNDGITLGGDDSGLLGKNGEISEFSLRLLSSVANQGNIKNPEALQDFVNARDALIKYNGNDKDYNEQLNYLLSIKGFVPVKFIGTALDGCSIVFNRDNVEVTSEDGRITKRYSKVSFGALPQLLSVSITQGNGKVIILEAPNPGALIENTYNNTFVVINPNPEGYEIYSVTGEKTYSSYYVPEPHIEVSADGKVTKTYKSEDSKTLLSVKFVKDDGTEFELKASEDKVRVVQDENGNYRLERTVGGWATITENEDGTFSYQNDANPDPIIYSATGERLIDKKPFTVVSPDGKITKTYLNASTTALLSVSFAQPNGEPIIIEAPKDGSLIENPNGTFTITNADGTTEIYDVNGISIKPAVRYTVENKIPTEYGSVTVTKTYEDASSTKLISVSFAPHNVMPDGTVMDGKVTMIKVPERGSILENPKDGSFTVVSAQGYEEISPTGELTYSSHYQPYMVTSDDGKVTKTYQNDISKQLIEVKFTRPDGSTFALHGGVDIGVEEVDGQFVLRPPVLGYSSVTENKDGTYTYYNDASPHSTTYSATGDLISGVDPISGHYTVVSEDGKITKIYEHEYSMTLVAAKFIVENGETLVLKAPENGSLIENEDGTFTLTNANGTTEVYDVNGIFIFGGPEPPMPPIPPLPIIEGSKIRTEDFFSIIDSNNDENITADEINNLYNKTTDKELKNLLSYLTDGKNVTEAFKLACSGYMADSYENGNTGITLHTDDTDLLAKNGIISIDSLELLSAVADHRHEKSIDVGETIDALIKYNRSDNDYSKQIQKLFDSAIFKIMPVADDTVEGDRLIEMQHHHIDADLIPIDGRSHIPCKALTAVLNGNKVFMTDMHGSYCVIDNNGTATNYDYLGNIIVNPYHPSIQDSKIRTEDFFSILDSHNDGNITADEINNLYNKTTDKELKNLLSYLTDGKNVTEAFKLACSGYMADSYEKWNDGITLHSNDTELLAKNGVISKDSLELLSAVAAHRNEYNSEAPKEFKEALDALVKYNRSNNDYSDLINTLFKSAKEANIEKIPCELLTAVLTGNGVMLVKPQPNGYEYMYGNGENNIPFDLSYIFEVTSSDDKTVKNYAASGERLYTENDFEPFTVASDDGNVTKTYKNPSSVTLIEVSFSQPQGENIVLKAPEGGSLVENQDGTFTLTNRDGLSKTYSEYGTRIYTENDFEPFTVASDDGKVTKTYKNPSSVTLIEVSFSQPQGENIVLKAPEGGSLVENETGTFTVTDKDGNFKVYNSEGIIFGSTYQDIAVNSSAISDPRNEAICKLMGWDSDSGITNAKYAGDNILSFECDGIIYNATYKEGKISSILGKKNGYKTSYDSFSYDANGNLKGKETIQYQAAWGSKPLSITTTKYNTDGTPTLEYIRSYKRRDGVISSSVVSYTYKSANYEVTNYCKKSYPKVSNYTQQKCTIMLANNKYLTFSNGEHITINEDGTIDVTDTNGNTKRLNTTNPSYKY